MLLIDLGELVETVQHFLIHDIEAKTFHHLIEYSEFIVGFLCRIMENHGIHPNICRQDNQFRQFCRIIGGNGPIFLPLVDDRQDIIRRHFVNGIKKDTGKKPRVVPQIRSNGKQLILYGPHDGCLKDGFELLFAGKIRSVPYIGQKLVGIGRDFVDHCYQDIFFGSEMVVDRPFA